MKKNIKFLVILTILLVSVLVLSTGCTPRLKKNTDYYMYGFDSLKGDFIQVSSKFVFARNTYTWYDTDNELVGCGDYQLNNNVLSLIPDKIGTENRMDEVSSIIVYKNYLINLDYGAISRVSEVRYEERSNLEGLYSNNIKLENGKLYKSIDDSNVLASFTEQIGTYEINKDKDFITYYYEDATPETYLIFTYNDEYNKEVKAFVPVFYSSKAPKFTAIKESTVELKQTIFENKSTEEEEAYYDLALISYPEKKTIASNVTYEVVGSSSATITNNVLSFKGTGSINIKYTYKSFSKTATIYIVDFDLKENLLDSATTFSVGDTASYSGLISTVADYTVLNFAYYSVELKNSTKAEAKNKTIKFLEAGTVEATLTIRYTKSKADGSSEIVELKKNITLTIEEA